MLPVSSSLDSHMSAEVVLLHVSRQILLQSLVLACHEPLLPGGVVHSTALLVTCVRLKVTAGIQKGSEANMGPKLGV